MRESLTGSAQERSTPISGGIGHYDHLVSRRESALAANPNLSASTRARILGYALPATGPTSRHRKMVAGDLGQYVPPVPATDPPTAPGFWWNYGGRLRRRVVDENNNTVVRVTPDDIMRVVAQRVETGGGNPFDVAMMKSARRSRYQAWPRQVAMLICIELRPDLSLPQIGKLFGNRDHTTVMHARTVTRERLRDGHDATTKLYHSSKAALLELSQRLTKEEDIEPGVAA